MPVIIIFVVGLILTLLSIKFSDKMENAIGLNDRQLDFLTSNKIGWTMLQERIDKMFKYEKMSKICGEYGPMLMFISLLIGLPFGLLWTLAKLGEL